MQGGLRKIIADFKECGRKDHLFSTSVRVLEIYRNLRELEKEIEKAKEDFQFMLTSQSGSGELLSSKAVRILTDILGPEVGK